MKAPHYNILTISAAAMAIAAGCTHGCEDPISSNIVINEVAAHGEYDTEECWIELYNSGAEEESLEGMGLYLNDNYFSGKEIWSGHGTLGAGQRLLLTVADGTLSVGFDSSDEFELGLGQSKSRCVDIFSRQKDAFGAALCHGGSYQRIPDGGQWQTMTYSTPGHENKVFCLEDYKNNAIWMWAMYMPDWLENDCAVLREMKEKGYDHVLLNYAGFDGKPDLTREFIRKAGEIGINVHAWIQCFHNSNGWVSPVDDENKCYRQDLYDDILAHAKSYIEDFGVKGLHMDYIRFGGTAYKHNWPEAGVTAEGAVVELCRQMRELVDSYNEGIVLSAAMMTDDNGSYYYYGQNQYRMSEYIDIFMPMVYRHQESGNSFSPSWSQAGANKFVVGGISQCWAGLQTYSYPSGKIKGMDSAQLLDECKIFSEGSKATGIVLFRYGYGDFPDVNELWNK